MLCTYCFTTVNAEIPEDGKALTLLCDNQLLLLFLSTINRLDLVLPPYIRELMRMFWASLSFQYVIKANWIHGN